jgi:FkbM family methyltransferase
VAAVGWWARLRHRRLLARLAGPRLLQAFAESHPQAFFVEIGANDGEQHDQLRPHVLAGGWRGIMVEPVPFVFERLQANYGSVPGVRLVNAAVTDRDGEQPFFHLREAGADPGLPSWYDGIGSFSRDAVLSHAPQIPDIEQRLVETRVATVTFDSLVGDAKVDLVLVDTEGHDWEVVRSIDLPRHRPRLLVYEHFHLDPAIRSQAHAHVEHAGYEIFEEGFDTYCLDPRPDDALTRRWRRLRPAIPAVSKHDEAAT